MPSQFRNLYPNYLLEQFSEARIGGDARIILASESSLNEDYQNHTNEVKLFVKEHQNHNTLLLQIPYQRAKVIADEQKFPSTDVGVFGNEFIVFFVPEDSGDVACSCKLIMEPLGNQRKMEWHEYLRRINGEAKEIKLVKENMYLKERSTDEIEADSERLLKRYK